MNIKSLLAAASLVALSTTTAHALAVTAVDATAGPAANNPAAGATNTGDVLATELDLTAAAVNGIYDFDVVRGAGPAAGAGFPTGVDLSVTVTLPAGRVLNGNQAGVASITSAESGSTAAGAVGSVMSGADGANSITFTINIANPSNNVIQIRGLRVSATADVNGGAMTVSVTNGGVEIDGAAATDVTSAPGVTPATTAVVFANSAPAVVVPMNAVASDEGASDTVVALTAPIYTTLTENGAAVGAGAATPLGTINYQFVAGRLVGLTNAMGTAVVKTPMTAASISNITMNFVPGRSTTGLGNAAITGTAATDAPAGGYTLVAATVADIATLTDNTPDVVTIASATGAAVAPIESQAVTIANATVNLNDTEANLVASVTGANGALDTLNRAGAAFGPFDWNGESITDSVYRFTGLPTGTTTGTVQFTNATGGAANNGVFPITLTSNNGEAVVTSNGTLAGINPGFVRADVTFNLETATTGIDVDRLLARNGIVSDFGGGANDQNAIDD